MDQFLTIGCHLRIRGVASSGSVLKEPRCGKAGEFFSGLHWDAYTGAKGVAGMAYYQYTVKYLCGEGDGEILAATVPA